MSKLLRYDHRCNEAKHDEVNLSFTSRNGAITQAEISIAEETLDNSAMLNKRLHEIENWQRLIPQSLVDTNFGISKWLNELFGTGPCKE
jgi:hypothetical protein